MAEVRFAYPTGETLVADVSVGDSLMRGAVIAGIAGIEGECGGALTCATCHVHVQGHWLDRLTPPDLAESELLEMVEDNRANSRLSCQIVMSAELDGIVVAIPQGNL